MLFRSVYEGMHSYRRNAKLLLFVTGVTLLLQAARVVSIWAGGEAVGVHLSIRPYFALGPLLFLVMLVPFTLGLCAPAGSGMEDAHASLDDVLARSGLLTALAVAAVHTLAMMAAGVAIAWAVYRYLGLQFLRRAWFNLDLAWAASLVLAGAAGVAMAW